MEAEDTVVKSIPVVLSKGLAGRLFLFEYQRERREVQDAAIGQKVTKSSIKPKQQKVQLQLELSKDSHNFNPGQAQKLASKGNPKSQQESGSSSRAMIESQVLVSSSALPSNPEKFAVGIVHEQSPGQLEIHLNPVQGILNLKQCYAYMDAPDKTEKKQDATNAATSGKVTKPINVRFARQDPKRMKLAQAKSLSAQQRIKDDEPWCETEFFKAESSESRLEREKLLSDQQESNTSTILVDSPEAFLPVLCSMPLNHQGDSENSTGPKSAQYISSLQFNEQVVARMRQVHVISYSRLKKYLDPNKSDTDIWNALQRAAVPIRGNWVVSSENLFPDTHVSSCGVKAEQLCRARNQILHMFMAKEMVEQREASQVTGLPSRDVVEILSKIAVQRKRRNPEDTTAGWQFKLPVDEDFLQRYADEVSRLEKRFETKVRNVGRRAEEDEVKASAASSPSKKGKAAPRQRKNSTKSRKDSYSSDH